MGAGLGPELNPSDCRAWGRPWGRAFGQADRGRTDRRALSDDGPDDPRWVAAITPTVHREIHYGEGGDDLNRRLKEKLKKIEKH